MTSVDHWFYGPHRHSGYHHQRVEENRRLALTRIADITVTPAELVEAIGADGVDYHCSERLVVKLLLRAEEAAVRRTLGLDGVVEEQPNDE